MRIIIWGLPLHSHTHSYIHFAFARASYHMGFETFWLENSIESNQYLQKDDVVICMGLDDNMLARKAGVNYVLHNSARNDLREENYINLQVYTNDVLNRNIENWGDLTFWQQDNKTLYQPWATDLLPYEIENLNPNNPKCSNDVFWIGSIMIGEHGNNVELAEYAELCKKNGINFQIGRSISLEDNISLIRKSRHSIAIQGKWQVEKGYIPCRVLKNLSYGNWTFTNSQTVASLLEIPCHTKMNDMFEAAEEFLANPKIEDLHEKMKLISDRHTYINRLNNIIKCIRG